MIAIAFRISVMAVLSLILLEGLPARVKAQASDRAFAGPVAVWPASPLEVVAVYAKTVPPEAVARLAGRSLRYEIPGVQESRGAFLRIAGTRLVDDGRTLLMATDPHPVNSPYALAPNPGDDPTIGLRYDLHGVELSWSAADADEDAFPWKGWLPDLDLQSLASLAQNSALHRRGLNLLKRPGRLTLSTLIAAPDQEQIALQIITNRPIVEASLGDSTIDPNADDRADGEKRNLSARSTGEPLFFSLSVETGPDERLPTLRVAPGSQGAGDRGVIPSQRLLLPWAPLPPVVVEPSPATVPSLDGGDARKGEALFFSEQARCFHCHRFQGKGGEIGPELSEVSKKGAEQFYRSVAAPSAEISPEFLPYTVALRDGRVFAGLVRAQGFDSLIVTDNAARATTLRRDEIDQIRPSGTSIMPVGLAGVLGDASIRDLYAFLRSQATPPDPRPRGE